MATEQELAQALNPAFGIYPKAFRGNYGNPEDAANLPVDVMRGRTAGLLGMFGDVVNQPIAFTPVRAAQLAMQGVMGQDKYPDTEHFLKTMPLAPTSRAGEVAGQAASFVPLNPAPLVRAGVAGAKALAPTAARMTEGYLQRQGLMPGVMPEQPSLLGNITTKPKAEVSPLGFYSAVEQQALNIPRKQGSGESFLNDLAKGQDVKKYEMETMGLDEFLRGKPNVTRQEVQDYIAGNRINVQERQLGGALSPEMQTTRDALSDKYKGLVDNIADAKSQFEEGKISYAQVRNTVSNNQVQIQALDTQINEINKTISPTKYERYQLPGGENYREILLTLPNKPMEASKAAENYYTQFVKRGGEPEWAQLNSVRQQEITNAMPAQARNASAAPEYRSSHFDEPNILAHMRVNDRIDADGKKMLLIEEVQSDWHQAGRERGYQGKGTLKELPDNYFVQEIKTIDGDTMYVVRDNNNPGVVLNKDYNKQSAINGVINELNATSAGGVPDAPFKDTWHQLALKRALKEAVDKGYDRIGLTTGAQQAERYNLAKQVDEVIAKRNPDGSFNLDATLVGGGTQQSIGKNIASDKLADYVGKDLATTMQSQTAGTDVYSGDALKVGGEGMKKYYDEIYPAFLNKQGKKYGAQVGETTIGKKGTIEKAGKSFYQTPDTKETVRYLDITPEMRKAIQEGQPIASIQN